MAPRFRCWMNVGLKWTSRVKGQSIMEIVCLYRQANLCNRDTLILIICRLLYELACNVFAAHTLHVRLCEWPLDLVVTDGAVYHILHLRGTSLMVMQNVSAQKGLKYIAKSLLSKVCAVFSEAWKYGIFVVLRC